MLPITDAKLVGFATWCSWPRAYPGSNRRPKPQGLLPQTISDYIGGIVSHAVLLGLPDPRDNAPMLERVLRGIRKVHGRPPRRRAPVTRAILCAIKTTLDVQRKAAHAVMWALFCVAFWALCRLGELTPRSDGERERAPPASRLTFVSNDHAMLFIPQSKTDPFRRGQHLHLFSQRGDPTCPLEAVRNARRLQKSPWLFSLDGRNPVTRNQVLAALQQCLAAVDRRFGTKLAAAGIGGHSFRRGMATELAKAGIPDSLLQAMGRWRGASFRAYLELGADTIRAAATAVSRAPAGMNDLFCPPPSLPAL